MQSIIIEREINNISLITYLLIFTQPIFTVILIIANHPEKSLIELPFIDYSHTAMQINNNYIWFVYCLPILLLIGKVVKINKKKNYIKEYTIKPLDYAYSPGRIYLKTKVPAELKFCFPDKGKFVVVKNKLIPMYVSSRQTDQEVFVEFRSNQSKDTEDYIFEELLSGIDISSEYKVILKVYQHKKRYFGVVEVEKCSI